MDAIVTGGAGFIGSQIVDQLINMGAKVKIFDNLTIGIKENINNKANFIFGDIRDTRLFSKALDNCT